MQLPKRQENAWPPHGRPELSVSINVSSNPNETGQSKSRLLRAEATAILEELGLYILLQTFGRVVVHGSYELDLMVWRDLDIYLCLIPGTATFQLSGFFELGARVAELLPAHRMHFRNELAAPTDGLPKGLYWGVHLREGPYGPWKIDIWAIDADELARLTEYQQSVARQLTPESRRVILEIKSLLHNHSEYRRGFGARQIYDAVLSSGVRDIAGFVAYLREKNGLEIDAEVSAG
jgi:hypothetical protein